MPEPPVPTLFAGPSAHRLPRALFARAGVRLRPPAARGDIEREVKRHRRAGVIVLCDGVFQSDPAVSHAELCAAIDAGWQLWGVSSLGAVRAYELRGEGMRGFGWVHRQFSRFADFTDDELAVLHLPAPSYLPLTEALVNLRFALERCGARLGIDAVAGRAALRALRARWFGDRTLARMRETLIETGRCAPAAADGLLGWMQAHRVKTLDLAALLAARPWRD